MISSVATDDFAQNLASVAEPERDSLLLSPVSGFLSPAGENARQEKCPRKNYGDNPGTILKTIFCYIVDL